MKMRTPIYIITKLELTFVLMYNRIIEIHLIGGITWGIKIQMKY